jgi:hypothetical protein
MNQICHEIYVAIAQITPNIWTNIYKCVLVQLVQCVVYLVANLKYNKINWNLCQWDKYMFIYICLKISICQSLGDQLVEICKYEISNQLQLGAIHHKLIQFIANNWYSYCGETYVNLWSYMQDCLYQIYLFYIKYLDKYISAVTKQSTSLSWLPSISRWTIRNIW